MHLEHIACSLEGF